MSGVGVSGLLANLPNTVTPYPIQDPAFELGGYRSVLDTTARDGIPANFRALGMQVTTTADGKTWQLVGGLLNANWQQVQGQAPFRGTYHVDPTFTGLQVGSASNPFTTAAAAFAAAAALALTAAVVLLPPGANLVEDIVFPATSGNWEIGSTEDIGTSVTGSAPTITGTVTATAVTAGVAIFGLRNVAVTGAVSGDISGGGVAVFYFDAARCSSTVTLTATAPSTWQATFRGRGSASPNQLAGTISGAVSIAGVVIGNNYNFRAGSVTLSGTGGPFNPPLSSTFRDCFFGSTTVAAITMALNSADLSAGFIDCYFAGPTTFTTTQTNFTLNIDGATLALLNNTAGMILGGTGSFIVKTINANASDVRTVAGNLGSTSYGARNVKGLWVVDYEMTLLAQGTLGALQFNIIFTDMTNTVVSIPVGTALDITGAVGSKQQGSLRFQHNGAAAPIAFQLTGITTPGSMSVAVASAIQRRN